MIYNTTTPVKCTCQEIGNIVVKQLPKACVYKNLTVENI